MCDDVDLIEESSTVPESDGGPSALMSMLPLAVIFVVFYFLVIRPQSKKIKKHNNMLENLKKNDKVVTSGGIIGTINKIVDKRVYLNISEDKSLEIVVDRNFISGLESETK